MNEPGKQAGLRPVGPTQAVGALVFAAVAYVVAFGFAIGDSFAMLGSRRTYPVASSWSSAQLHVLLTVFGLAAGAVACLLLTTGEMLACTRLRAALRAWLGTGAARGVPALSAGWWLLGLVVTWWLQQLLSLSGTIAGTSWAHEPIGPAVLDAVCAGVGEELLVLALPVLVLRGLFGLHLDRPSWRAAVLALLVVLRVLYHVYYGIPTVAALAVWALVAALVFWRFGCAWPLVVIHAATDGFLILENNGVLGGAVVAVIATIVAAGLVTIGARRTRASLARSG